MIFLLQLNEQLLYSISREAIKTNYNTIVETLRVRDGLLGKLVEKGTLSTAEKNRIEVSTRVSE